MESLLSKKKVKNMVSGRTFLKGESYFEQGRVRNLYFDPARNEWHAQVRGTKAYDVLVHDDGHLIETECSCPAYAESWDHCKHIVAVMLKIQDEQEGAATPAKIAAPSRNERMQEYYRQQEEYKKKLEEEARIRQIEWERQLQERKIARLRLLADSLIGHFAEKHNFAADDTAGRKTRLAVEWTLRVKSPNYNGTGLLYLEMKVGEKRVYVVKKVKEFLKAIEARESYYFAKNFTYDPRLQEFSEDDGEIIRLLLDAVKTEHLYHEFKSYYSYSSMSDDRYIVVPAIVAEGVLAKLADKPIRFENGTSVYDSFSYRQGEMPVVFKLEAGMHEEYHLNFSGLENLADLMLYGCLVNENTVYRLSPEQIQIAAELMKVAKEAGSKFLPIAPDQIEAFLAHAAPMLDRLGSLRIAAGVSDKIVREPLEAKIYIDLRDGILEVRPEYRYGGHTISPFDNSAGPDGKDGPILARDAGKERAIMDILQASPLQVSGKTFYASGEEEIYTFLYGTMPLLEGRAEVMATAGVKSLFFTGESKPVTTIDVDSSGNWLEVRFDIEGINEDDIQEILRSAVENKKYYRLPDGAFLPLEAEGFAEVRELFDELGAKPSQLGTGMLKLPLYRGVQLDDVMGRRDGQRNARYGRHFRRLLQRLNNPDQLEFNVPENLNAGLRDYQEYGFQWLKTLGHYRFGGILADDMGLGKTIQSIAFILSEREEHPDAGPALIVAPASLVYNWRNEFRKFAPSLHAEVMIGTRQERQELLNRSEIPDVWITSYPTLRQDIDDYREIEFGILILDEAQAVKNFATKAARAVREIKAGKRFALSGTPIENSIDELWSIFQAIMPDFFPNQAAFRKMEPEKVARMVRPFLLRRVKKDVLKELPDKIETIHYSELTKEQKTLYLAYLERIQQEARESLEGEGFQKSRIKILAGLTRLRQLCCHPGLFLENYEGDSGKLQQLIEIAGNAVENGRRLLIFSQFTGMLSIIRRQLEEAGVGFFYLDGQTPAKDRVDMADRFNQGEKEVFLISLKAGNTGLNLTGADTVILYDLWWNPAVEEQAAGRAHRIGQKNVVQVIRMVSEGTIEEKIFELQQNKKELIDTVVQPGDPAATTITEQEIRQILNI